MVFSIAVRDMCAVLDALMVAQFPKKRRQVAYEVPRRSHERHCDVFHASWLHTYTSASGMESPSSSPPQCTRKRCCDSFARPLRCSQSMA